MKLASPEETRNQADAMLASVDTRAFASEDLGDFPTAATLAVRRRQLSARRLDGKLLLLHVVSAGADATGRPGNVFVHGALGAAVDGTAIEHWHSDGWLMPYGPSAVAAAKLPEHLERGTVITRATVAAHLVEPGRLELLAVLLEQISQVAGPLGPVVLLVEDPDEAAWWIGAVTFLRDPRSDGDIGWTTWARAEALSTLASAGLSLFAVSHSEADGARTWVRETDGAVLIDTSIIYRLADDGDSWLAPDGTQVAVADIPTACVRALRQGVEEFGADLLRDLLDDVPLAVADSSTDYGEPLWAVTAIALCDPDLQVDKREELTWTVLMFGPQESQSPVVTAVIDRWWQEQPTAAAKAIVGPDVVTKVLQAVLRRRAVLLLAGRLSWDDDLDGPFALSDEDRTLIEPEVANAVKRFEALTGIPNRLDEAAQILRVFDCYGIGLEVAAVAAARSGLLEGLDEPERQRLTELATPPRRTPPFVAMVPVDLAKASEIVTVRVPDRGPPEIPSYLPSPPSTVVPRPVPPAARPQVRVPAPPAGARPATGGRVASRAMSVVQASKQLSSQWRMLMTTALHGAELPPSAWQSVADNVAVVDAGDLAAELLLLEDPTLFALLREALRVTMSRNEVDTPFAIGRAENLSNSLLYHVAVAALIEIIAVNGNGRMWTLTEWDEHIALAVEKRLGRKNPLSGAWGKAKSHHQWKGTGRA
ncbi:hypothetical protein ASE01_12140 [Nocardioides sp. Root190]|nr:hypothetical protein ASE01_12140 [Nocardioides sp. Root190]